MKTVILALTLLGTIAHAETNTASTTCTTNCNTVIVQVPVAAKSKSNGSSLREIKRLKAEIESLKAQLSVKKTTIVEKIVTIEKPLIVHRSVVVEKRVVVERYKKNAISLLGLYQPTKLVTSGVDASGNFNHAETRWQTDVGAMYQHDFSSLRGSVGISVRGSALLGVGYAF